ncbi:MAG: TIGR02453 family protein [Chitinivibrionales bacterium]|nr:TIGR02453 family protein [Chitinivibrionales bacterium]
MSSVYSNWTVSPFHKEQKMAFKGFPQELITFFDDLEKNNSKKWFDAHRQEYEEFVKLPAGEFTVAMGEKVASIAPDIQAVPKVNQSLFRLNRDVRFSADKRPYKTNLGIWLWEGTRKRMECPGYYFHYANGQIMFAAGLHMMPKHILAAYRDAVVHAKHGLALKKAIRKVEKLGYEVGEKQYKKVPRGCDPSHPNADYLLFGGLTAVVERPVSDEFFTSKIVTLAFRHYKNMSPLNEWLKEAIV